MTSLAKAVGSQVSHPLLEVRPVKVTGLLVVSGDRGLAGSYNSAILRKAFEKIRGVDPNTLKIFTVGRKSVQFFRRRGYNVVAEFSVNNTAVTFSDTQQITNAVRNAFEAGEIDELIIFYTQFKTAITQYPREVLLLPIQPPVEEASSSTVKENNDYIFEPNPTELMQALLPKYLEGQIYQALLDSTASEHGARMTAMTSATDNAGKMINTLTLQLNRARQAGITREISEIVGGAEALKG